MNNLGYVLGGFIMGVTFLFILNAIVNKPQKQYEYSLDIINEDSILELLTR